MVQEVSSTTGARRGAHTGTASGKHPVHACEEDIASSVTSDASYSSDEDGAADLAVEASPQRIDGDGKVNGGNVDASFYSDYDAARTPEEDAAIPFSSPPTPPPTGQNQREKNKPKSAIPSAPLDAADGGGDGDGFYDAEYASSRGGRREAPSAAPPPDNDVAAWTQQNVYTSSSCRGGRSGSWVDPLDGAPGSTTSTKGVKYQTREDSSHRQGLSDSPVRCVEPLSEPRRDTVPYRREASAVPVREATAAPPPRQLKPSAPFRRRQVPVRSPSLSSAPLSISEGVRAQQLNEGELREVAGAGGPCGTTHAPPIPFPLKRHDFNARASVSLDNESTATASPPPRQPCPNTSFAATTAAVASASLGDHPTEPSVVRALVPGLHHCPHVHEASPPPAVMTELEQQTRVVRERATPGAPLLRQCTGHAAMLTRTILVSPAVEDDDDATVTAGVHTSAFRETSVASDLLDSTTGSPYTGVERNAAVQRQVETPERPAHRRPRTMRSKSPIVSLADTPLSASFAAGAAEPVKRASEPRPSQSVPSPDPTPLEDDAQPELVEFSVHTEALDRSAQEQRDTEDNSLVLCSYSVESFPLSLQKVRNTARSPAVDSSGAPSSCLRTPVALPPSVTRARRAEQASDTWRREERRWSEAAYYSPPPPQPQARAEISGSSLCTQHRERHHHYSRPSPHTSPLVEVTEDESGFFWTAPEPVYAAPRAQPLARTTASATHPPQLRHHGVDDLVDSVEETGAGLNGSYLSPTEVRYATHLTQYDDQYGDFSLPPQPHHAGDFETSRDDVSLPPHTQAYSGRAYICDAVHSRQQQRNAVHQLLAQQANLRRPSRHHSCARDFCIANEQESQRVTTHVLPAAAYVAQQEQLRQHRRTEEAQRLRLELAKDVCRAVRPYARDLLLMFLLLVEETTNAQQRRRSHGTIAGAAAAAAGETEESRVTYELCAEAVNCVLERHGVNWVRATRELCLRIVAWCQHAQQELYGGAPQRHAVDGEATPTVEYTTFVSFVMELAAKS